jgi:hypothetical protein
VPENKRTPEIEDYIVKGAEHMLNHHIHKRSQPPSWVVLNGCNLVFH